MQKRAQIEVSGNFIEFGQFNWSDIAYNDITRWFQYLSMITCEKLFIIHAQ